MSLKNFGELTPEEVMTLAINVEESNGTRLRTFADLFSDYAPDVAGLFAEMADEEDQHRDQLKVASDRRFGEYDCVVTEEDVWEVVEPFDLEAGEHFVFDDMTLRRALESVLAAEIRAEAFYRQACEGAKDPDLQELFRQLAEFEDGHVQWIEKRLESLGGTA
ncbi:MAG: hypothetical protein CMJ48_12065 [Planctomycetaceae bacterium]|nr:hypothetical protein [Planctomycetaceae bacterium]